jgi:hypothetical protein
LISWDWLRNILLMIILFWVAIFIIYKISVWKNISI